MQNCERQETDQFCDDHADTSRSSQGQRTPVQNLGVPLLVAVICGNDDLGFFWVGYQVHGTAHTYR